MNRLLALTIAGILYSCVNQKEYTFDEFKSLKPTHKVVDSIILKPIEDLFFEKKLLSTNKNECGEIYINYNKLNNTYKIQVSTTDFYIEKNNLFDTKHYRLEGYFTFQNIPFLLYGEIDSFFDNTDNQKVKDIFYLKKTFKGILPIYEPSIYEYELQNGKLKFNGEIYW